MQLEDTSRTVRNLLRRLFEFHISANKPYLRPIYVKKRLEWAEEHMKWTVHDSESVLRSDEDPFNIFGAKGQASVQRCKGERLYTHCVQQTNKHSGGKMIIWGCLSAEGIGKLFQFNSIMDAKLYKQILVNHAKPALKQLGFTTFQNYNDPKNTSKKVTKYLTGIVWPATHWWSGLLSLQIWNILRTFGLI